MPRSRPGQSGARAALHTGDLVTWPSPSQGPNKRRDGWPGRRDGQTLAWEKGWTDLGLGKELADPGRLTARPTVIPGHSDTDNHDTTTGPGRGAAAALAYLLTKDQ